jgi:hypothetical protein
MEAKEVLKLKRRAPESARKALKYLLQAQRDADNLERMGENTLNPAWREAVADALHAMRVIRGATAHAMERSWKLPHQ